jgi:hypothetical protein
MKLPDFTNNVEFRMLREAMGAHAPGNFSTSFRRRLVTSEELGLLGSSGIDISFDELTELEDGTLAYKDERVLVYIRDVSVFGGKFDLPRFHIASCRTLREMREKNRFGKYVAASPDDGIFEIKRIVNGQLHGSAKAKLRVCQNCLDALSFDNFSYDLAKTERSKIVTSFTIQRFFEKYPKSLHLVKPKHNYWSAPINQYGVGFSEAAKKYKVERNWTCAKCGLDFSNHSHRKYLHAHHGNALKYDNSKENIRVLCLGCHAEEPNHGHMKQLSSYKEFQAKFGMKRLAALQTRRFTDD